VKFNWDMLNRLRKNDQNPRSVLLRWFRFIGGGGGVNTARQAYDEALRARNEALSYHTYANERLKEVRVQNQEAVQNMLMRFHKQAGMGRTRPARVLFLVAHTSLWDVFGPIYAAMAASDDFEPSVLAFRRVDVTPDLDATEIKSFFAERGITARLEGWQEDGRFEPLDPEAYDILFYTLGSVAYPRPYKQEFTSLFFLTCYLSYGFLLVNEDEYQFNQDFHHAAWRIFSSTQREQRLYEKFSLRTFGNAVQTGYPKFDLFREDTAPARDAQVLQGGRPIVIWAPHWTIGQIYPRLNLGIFDQICMDMLDVFKEFREVDFVFKPHPNLKYALEASACMSTENYEAWLGMMKSCGNVRMVTQGDYFPLFKASGGMITDSVSFLAEYLPTGRPLQFLNRPDRAKMSDVGEEIISLHYSGRGADDIRSFIRNHVVGARDPLRAVRMERMPELLGLGVESASARILGELRSAFGLNTP
jgi:hypothetical protein